MEATAVSPTTSAPSSPPPAAPATSAPAETTTPVQRPTMADAFAQDAATASSTPPAPEGTATTAPAAETTPDSAQGPIPFSVHKTALENARTKAAEQVRTQLQQEYGWTQGIDRTTAEAGMQIGRLYQQDRAGFIRQVLAEAIADPQMSQVVRSEAARVLGTRRSAEAQPPDLSPDIPVMDANGQVVAQTYSAQRVQQIVQQAIAQAMQQEIGPLKQDYTARQQREQVAQVQREIETVAHDTFREVEGLPGFAEHKDDIARVFASIPGDPAKALRQAWQTVVGPKLGVKDQITADTLKTLQTHAAAAMTNPATAAMPATKRPRSFTDPSLKWE